MYYSFQQALALINEKLSSNGLEFITEGEAKDFGVVDDMGEDGINDIVREIRYEDHANRYHNGQPDILDFLEFMDEYDHHD